MKLLELTMQLSRQLLCIDSSKAEANDTNLKYITPITPHQIDAPIVYNEPLNKFFFI